MKILFISNTFRDFSYYPLGLLYLGGALRKEGHEVRLLEGEADERLLDQVRRWQPRIIAYSLLTGNHQFYLQLNRFLKERYPGSFISVFGGPHPTFSPQMVREEGVDAICRGEGEGALAEFALTVEKGGDWSTVRNFWVKKKDQVAKNPVRPKIADLDSIPFPDLSLLGSERLRRFYSRFVLVGRGCPFDCPYCFNHAYNQIYDGQPIVRSRSVGNVLKEIRIYVEAKEGRVRYIKFLDDNFIVEAGWLAEFARDYPKFIGLPFNCLLRPELVTEDRICRLKEAGCTEIIIGIESGDREVREKVLERKITDQQIITAARTIKRHGITLTTENMMGLPHENLAQALQTVYLNITCRTDIPIASIYTPYPGTKLGEYCLDHPVFGAQLDREKYIDSIRPTYFERSILNIPDRVQKENLAKIFAVMVKAPLLIPFLLRMLRFDAPRIYTMCFKVQFAYFALKKHGLRLFSPLTLIRQGFRMFRGKGWEK